MITLTCAIVDDEPYALDLLENYIQKTPMLRLSGRYTNGVQALYGLESSPVDLVFLDIQMPELDGLKLAKKIGCKTRIVFTTAFNQYALESYRVNALDYLVKPLSYSDFLQSVGKALTWFELKQDAARGLALSAVATPLNEEESDENVIFVRSNHRLMRVDLKKILYIEGNKNYVNIILEDREDPIVTISSLKVLESYLPQKDFMRVHRSFIVQIKKITVIENGNIIFKKMHIPIGEAYKAEFQAYIKGNRPQYLDEITSSKKEK